MPEAPFAGWRLAFAVVAAALVCATVARAAEGDEPEAPIPFSYGFEIVERQVVGSGQVTVAIAARGTGPSSGYYPLSIYLTSTAPTVQDVRLSVTGLAGGTGHPMSRTVKLEPGERKTVFLPVPVSAGYSELRAQAPGLTEGGKKPFFFNRVMRPNRAVLALGTPDEFQALVAQAPTPTDPSVTVMTVSANEAPDEFAAYVGFDEVVLTRVPPDELTEARRRALDAYAATGGSLVIGRPTRGAATYFPGLKDSGPGRHPYGFGTLTLCAEKCTGAVEAGLEGVEPRVNPRGPQPAWMRRSMAYAYPSPGSAAEGALLPQAVAPVGRFLLIIVAFTLALGPGSVWVARRLGQAMLLVTIPATAALASGALVGYSAVAEGFSVHAATRGFTLLDRAHQRAVTVGLAAYYANLAPAGAQFGATTALVGPDASNADVQSATVDWTSGQRYGSDFLPSRTYREWGVLSADPTRARLAVRQTPEGWTVQNALGSPLRAAHLRLDGKDWRVTDVPDGGSAKAVLRTTAVPLPGVDVREYSSRFGARVLEVAKAELAEGEFLAQVEGPSLMPVGGLRLELHDAEHLVRGEVDR